MEKNQIIKKRRLAVGITEYVIYAPLVSKHCLAGQFIILRTDEDGERVPFTICDFSREDGSVSILVQEVGYTTMKLSLMKEGECLQDFAGPLGNPTDLSAYDRVLLIGGGIGTAVIYPQAKHLKSQNKYVDAIIGAKNKSLLMYADEFARCTDNLYFITDDGSNGRKGFVTDMLKELIANGNKYDCVLAVGPLPMMRAVCVLTREMGIKTIVSMNCLMVDGTGMCGCCRLSVGGEIKYACIDGPEFDGHSVNFEETINRNAVYRQEEQEHICRLRRQYGKID